MSKPHTCHDCYFSNGIGCDHPQHCEHVGNKTCEHFESKRYGEVTNFVLLTSNVHALAKAMVHRKETPTGDCGPVHTMRVSYVFKCGGLSVEYPMEEDVVAFAEAWLKRIVTREDTK